MAGTAPLLLIHGGLWEDMDARRFWVRPGIVDALRSRGFTVLAPDRLRRPRNWPDEATHLAAELPAEPVILVAGSNGCSAAVRLAIARPAAVAGLLLAWPARAGDPAVDARVGAYLREAGADPATIDALLAGETLRGVRDAELAALSVPTRVLPSVPENPFHRTHTVDALLHLVPGAVAVPGCPEPPNPEFAGRLPAFVDEIVRFAGSSG